VPSGEQSSARLSVTTFGKSQLGGHPETLSHSVPAASKCWRPFHDVSIPMPLSGLPSIGFAVLSYEQVWAAMDGGRYPLRFGPFQNRRIIANR